MTLSDWTRLATLACFLTTLSGGVAIVMADTHPAMSITTITVSVSLGGLTVGSYWIRRLRSR